MKGYTLTELLEDRFKGVKFRISYSEFGTLYIDYITKKRLSTEAIADFLKDMTPRPENYSVRRYEDDWK